MCRRWQAAGILLIVGAAACGPGAPERAVPSAFPAEVLLLRDGTGLRSVEASTGLPRTTYGDATLSADGSSAAALIPSSAGTVLREFDVLGGGVLGGMSVPEGLESTVASASGSLVALATPRQPGATAWLPDGRAETRISIADLDSETLRDFELEGNFEPEAFATDGSELFMIEYLPAMDPDRYRVRRLRLRNGRVLPIGFNKQAAPEQMRGTGRMQVLDPSAEQLYTLYTRQGPNYAHGADPGPEDAGEVHAFVHLLNLKDSWAHCIDLPEPFGTGNATASAIAMSLAGGPLYVTDWSNGAVAVINPDRLRVRKVQRLPLGAPDDQTFTQASWSNGLLYVAGNDEVVLVSTSELEVKDRWAMPKEVTSLLLSGDGLRLYVGQSDRVLILDAVTGEQRGALPAPGLTSLEGVVDPAP